MLSVEPFNIPVSHLSQRSVSIGMTKHGRIVGIVSFQPKFPFQVCHLNLNTDSQMFTARWRSMWAYLHVHHKIQFITTASRNGKMFYPLSVFLSLEVSQSI